VDTIGEAKFTRQGDGDGWMAYSGEIIVNPFTTDEVKVGGFKAAGLSVRDCILLTLDPPDVKKSPFLDARQVIPVRLTTDKYSADGTGVGVGGEVHLGYGRTNGAGGGRQSGEFSIPSDPSYHDADDKFSDGGDHDRTPELGYAR